ncbi:hypothetical protein C8R45DRAFT_1105839 [Mycena sanguinolenta]|nr:hypothetical protein C8R45DRAFT_1105839 [Mycena sanguinolenta]
MFNRLVSAALLALLAVGLGASAQIVPIECGVGQQSPYSCLLVQPLSLIAASLWFQVNPARAELLMLVLDRI